MEQPTTLKRLESLWENKQRFLRFQITEPWTSFRLRRAYDLRMLTRSDVRIMVPAGQTPACALCRDVCCRGVRNTVTLRLRDLAAFVDLGLTSAISYDAPYVPRKAQTPAMSEFLGSELWRRFPKLKQTESGACCFLETNNRCAIFDHAPLACQRFPFALSPDRKTVFYSPRCLSHSMSDLNERAYQRHIDAVLTNYNEMIKDLVLLSHGWRELTMLGLARFISR